MQSSVVEILVNFFVSNLVKSSAVFEQTSSLLERAYTETQSYAQLRFSQTSSLLERAYAETLILRTVILRSHQSLLERAYAETLKQ